MQLVPDDSWAILTIYGEAAGEPMEGKLAVAHVIRNRMRFKYQSDGTVVGTVLKPFQFSMWSDRARLMAARADDEDERLIECKLAWYESDGFDGRPVGDAVLYFNPDVVKAPAWASKVRFVRKIGAHQFYEDPITEKRKTNG